MRWLSARLVHVFCVLFLLLAMSLIPLSAATPKAAAQDAGGPTWVNVRESNTYQLLTQEDAVQTLITQVIQPDTLDHYVFAFGMAEPLPGGTAVAPYAPHPLPEAATHLPYITSETTTILSEATWFFWVDDVPFAEFIHPTRFVFIDATTGVPTVAAEQWPPYINGEPVLSWIETASRWDSANWVFSNVPAEEIPPEYTATAAEASPLPATGSGNEAIVVSNGWSTGQTGAETFTKNVVKAAGFSNDSGIPWYGTFGGLSGIEDGIKSAIEGGANDIFLYFTGHGGQKADGTSYLSVKGEVVTPAQLANVLKKFPNVRFKVVLQCCHSGGFITALKNSGQVDIILTSAAADEPSYMDWDPSFDPNPLDTGSEYSSGLWEDLQATLTDPAMQQRVQQVMESTGWSQMVARLSVADVTAIAKDATAINGDTHPQNWVGPHQTVAGVSSRFMGFPSGTGGYVGFDIFIDPISILEIWSFIFLGTPLGSPLGSFDYYSTYGQPLTAANAPFQGGFEVADPALLPRDTMFIELRGPGDAFLGFCDSSEVFPVWVDMDPTSGLSVSRPGVPGLPAGVVGDTFIYSLGNYTDFPATVNGLAPDGSVIWSQTTDPFQFNDVELQCQQPGIYGIEVRGGSGEDTLFGRVPGPIIGQPLTPDMIGQQIPTPPWFSIQNPGDDGGVTLRHTYTGPGVTGEAYEHIGPNSNVLHGAWEGWDQSAPLAVTSATLTSGSTWSVYSGSQAGLPPDFLSGGVDTTTTIDGCSGEDILFPASIEGWTPDPGPFGQASARSPQSPPVFWNPSPDGGWQEYTFMGVQNVGSGAQSVRVSFSDAQGEVLADPIYRLAIEDTDAGKLFIAEAVLGTVRVVHQESATEVLVEGPGDMQNLARLTITEAGEISEVTLHPIDASWPEIILGLLLGDANGDGNINAVDITKVERIIVGLDAATPGADANQDGNINALDITKVERIIAGLD